MKPADQHAEAAFVEGSCRLEHKDARVLTTAVWPQDLNHTAAFDGSPSPAAANRVQLGPQAMMRTALLSLRSYSQQTCLGGGLQGLQALNNNLG